MAYVSTYVYVYPSTCIYVCIYMYTHTYMYLCTYTCIHMYIHIQDHTSFWHVVVFIQRYMAYVIFIQRCMSDMHVVTHPEAQGIRSLVIFTFPSPHLPSPVCHTHSRFTPLPVSHTCQLPSYPTPFTTDSHRHALTPFTLTATF